MNLWNCIHDSKTVLLTTSLVVLYDLIIVRQGKNNIVGGQVLFNGNDINQYLRDSVGYCIQQVRTQL